MKRRLSNKHHARRTGESLNGRLRGKRIRPKRGPGVWEIQKAMVECGSQSGLIEAD